MRWVEFGVEYVIAFTDIRMSLGGQALSHEACAICAVLIMSMPDPKLESAVEYAKRLGTYNKLDRSQQYAGRYSNEILKRNDDLLFERLRKHEEREFRHRLILGLIALVPTILVFVMWYYG